MFKEFRKIFFFLSIVSALLSSCDKEDYINSIPRNCIAIIETPASTFDISIAGIDTTRQVYVFETSDGMLGLCASVKDEYMVDEYLQNMKKTGKAGNFTEYDGIPFCTMSEAWVTGYNNNTLLILGPVIAAERTKTIKRISRLFEQDEEKSIIHSDIWQHLNSSNNNTASHMAMHVSALPEQFSAYFTIGIPKGTSLDDLILEGSIDTEGNDILINGHTSSYNPNVKQQLQRIQQTMYRPISFDWTEAMDSNAIVNIFMNVDGKELLSYLHNNKSLNTLLLGSDAYDKIKQNDGNIVISVRKEQHSDDKQYKATIQCIQDESSKTKNKDDKQRLVVIVDIETLTDGLGKNLIPLLGNIKRIKYSLTE